MCVKFITELNKLKIITLLSCFSSTYFQILYMYFIKSVSDKSMVTVMETQQDSMGVGSHIDSDEDDDCPSSPGSPSYDDGALMAAAMGHDVTAQLAAAGWQNIHGTFVFAFFLPHHYYYFLFICFCILVEVCFIYYFNIVCIGLSS